MKRHFCRNLCCGLAVLTLTISCGGEPGDPLAGEVDQLGLGLSGDQTYGPLLADADLSVPLSSSIYFAPEWRESISQPLFRGAEVTITASAERFPHCGSAGLVIAFIGYPDGQVVPVGLMNGEPGHDRWGSVTLRADVASIDIWLKAKTSGCVEWDSQYGANYRFELRPWSPARIRLDADWSERVTGRLVKGGVAVIDYDWARLPNCRIIYRGWPGWDIIAHARFDDGAQPPGQSVAYMNQGMTEKERRLAVFVIPSSASAIELWFENSEYPPLCHEWDSDYGRNYRFDIGD